MPQSRYLFAISCFQMDLLNEAEMALCSSSNEPNVAEIHRMKSVAQQFNQTLSRDPLLWATYEELCKIGAAGEATTVFGESASECIQKQYLLSQDVSPQSRHHPLMIIILFLADDKCPNESGGCIFVVRHRFKITPDVKAKDDAMLHKRE